MKLLVLGGTRFVGRHLVEEALGRGHAVTLFHRGRSGPELFGGVERVLGDRREDLSGLGNGEWDACVDTSGYLPSEIARSTECLEGRVARYLFVSTISVLADPSLSGLDEDAPLAELPPGPEPALDQENYGALKAAAEGEVRRRFGERALILRPGLVVGPHDPTDRFSYWVWRLSRGGVVLAPAPAAAQVQWIDGRDLARFAVDLLERGASGTYAVTGPHEATSLGELLSNGLELAGGDGRLEWIDPSFLLERGVRPFADLPLWIPDEGPRGLMAVDTGRARRAGLVTRPLEQSFGDTLAWLAGLGLDRPLAAGLSPERERALLAAWSAERQVAPARAFRAGHEI
jgi:2'-hydroxyisoflavone reductase